jgi:Spy/CpxP family protein refolding chaperone
MNVSKSIIMAALFCTPLAFGSIAHAETDHHEDNRGMGQHIEKMFDELNLTDEQKNLLKANREKTRASAEKAHQGIKDNMKAMGEELKKTDYSVDKLKALAEESKRLHNEKIDAKVAGMIEVRKILTPEQFAQFSKMMEEKMSKWESKRYN